MAFKISNASLNITYIYLLSYSVIILVPVCQQLLLIAPRHSVRLSVRPLPVRENKRL